MTITERIFGKDATLVNPAWLCVVAGVLLSLIGVYCIDVGSQMTAPAAPSDLSARAIKHLVFLFAGLIAAAVVAFPDYRKLRFIAWPVLGVCLVLLIFLLVPFVPSSIVYPRNGVRAWINFGSIDLQPSELAKIAYVLVMADYLRVRENHRTLLGLIPPAIITAIPMGLIFLQPDLGMAILFIPVLFAVLVAAGARLKHLLLVVALATLTAPAAWPLLKPYQRQRVLDAYYAFTDQARVQTATSTQPETARTVLGAGQWGGYSDAQARAVVRYSRLPERHNDMIFAVVVARFGLVGGLGVIALMALWLLGAMLTASFTKDGFGRLLCVGLATFVFCQVAINIGMVVGVAPVIGLTLPFVSYGGSSMIALWIMTGLIFAVAVRKPNTFAGPAFHFKD